MHGSLWFVMVLAGRLECGLFNAGFGLGIVTVIVFSLRQ